MLNQEIHVRRRGNLQISTAALSEITGIRERPVSAPALAQGVEPFILPDLIPFGLSPGEFRWCLDPRGFPMVSRVDPDFKLFNGVLLARASDGHWVNPKFSGKPWSVDQPLELSFDEPEWAKAEWAKLVEMYNRPAKEEAPPAFQSVAFDRGLKSGWQDPDDSDWYKAPKKKMSDKAKLVEKALISVIDAKKQFPVPDKLPVVLYDGPEHVTPVLDSFDSGGSAAAKIQIAEKDFVPAELPAASVRDWWEAQLRKYAKTEPFYYINQDLNGNPAGQKFNTVRQTTVAKPQKQVEIDALMRDEYKRRKLEGKTTKEEDVVASTFYGMKLRDAGRIIGKGKEAMKSIRRRMYAPTAGVAKVIEALRNTKERGWFIVVKVRFRPAYYCKLDAPENATDDELSDAIDRGATAEATRILHAEFVRTGMNKMFTPEGVVTEEARAMSDAIWLRVWRAFEKGYLVKNSDCPGPPECPTCSSMLPVDAKAEEQDKQETIKDCERFLA